MPSFFVAILSPSKLMNESFSEFHAEATAPIFISETEQLCSELKLVSVAEWKRKMLISDDLAVQTQHRFQTWNKKNLKKGIPAALLFSGEAFKSLDAKSFDEKKWKQAGNSLRILSGFYGVLKPTDCILPYRLMVGTPFKTSSGQTLYNYWNKKVTESLEKEISANGYLLNLASDEYFKLIDTKNFNRKTLHFKFLQTKGKDLKSIPTFSKQARGSMARFVIETNPKKLEDLHKFNSEGYSFNALLSDSNTMVFVR